MQPGPESLRNPHIPCGSPNQYAGPTSIRTSTATSKSMRWPATTPWPGTPSASPTGGSNGFVPSTPSARAITSSRGTGDSRRSTRACRFDLRRAAGPGPEDGQQVTGLAVASMREAEPRPARPSGSRRHLPAFLGTPPARLRTPPAVVGLMRRAFGRASVTRLGTGATDRRRQGRSPAHEPGARPAQLRTVAAGADAFGHRGMADTGIAAMLTFPGTNRARLDATPECFMGHRDLLPWLPTIVGAIARG